MFYRADGGLGRNEIGRWLGVSHRVGPMMTYRVLPKSGIPISTDTVQSVTRAERTTDAIKEQMEQGKHATTKNLDAKSANIAWKPDAIPRRSLFDFTQEDETFLSNFNQPITTEGIADNDQEGSDRVGDALDAPNYIGMEVGIRRGAEGELQRAKVR